MYTRTTRRYVAAAVFSLTLMGVGMARAQGSTDIYDTDFQVLYM